MDPGDADPRMLAIVPKAFSARVTPEVEQALESEVSRVVVSCSNFSRSRGVRRVGGVVSRVRIKVRRIIGVCVIVGVDKKVGR